MSLEPIGMTCRQDAAGGPVAAQVYGGGGSFQVMGGHGYAEEGSFTVSVADAALSGGRHDAPGLRRNDRV